MLSGQCLLTPSPWNGGMYWRKKLHDITEGGCRPTVRWSTSKIPWLALGDDKRGFCENFGWIKSEERLMRAEIHVQYLWAKIASCFLWTQKVAVILWQRGGHFPAWHQMWVIRTGTKSTKNRVTQPVLLPLGHKNKMRRQLTAEPQCSWTFLPTAFNRAVLHVHRNTRLH